MTTTTGLSYGTAPNHVIHADNGIDHAYREIGTGTAYLADSNPADPRCSAVFADKSGLPPLLIQVGENEILYDDGARIRDGVLAAGVDVTFESWEHGIHVWPVYIATGLPESALAIEHLATFLKAGANATSASRTPVTEP